MNENYLNEAAEDFVIDTHVNAGWVYRKWFAGEAEAWGSFTIQPTYANPEGAGYYYSVSIPLPTGVFIQPPVVVASTKCNWLCGFVPSQNVSKNYITGYIWALDQRALTGGNSIELQIIAKSTWK